MTGIYRKECRDLGLADFCGRFPVTGSCAEKGIATMGIEQKINFFTPASE